MSVITEWLERVEAEKKDEGFYIGDFDVQINNICVICNVSDIIIDDGIVIFKMDNGWTTATFIEDSIKVINYN